jgi:chromosome segregation ATPase
MTGKPHLAAAVEAGEIKQCPHCGIYWSPTRQTHECVDSLRAELATMTERAENAESALRGLPEANDEPTGDDWKELRKELDMGPLTTDRERVRAACAEIAKLRAELSTMRVESSNHAAAAETARMERDAALADLEAAQKEIAELRARKVRLPESESAHGFHSHETAAEIHGYNDALEDCATAIRAAGVEVES